MSQFDALFKTTNQEKKEAKQKTKTPEKKPDTSLSPAEKTSPAKQEKRTTGKSSSPDYTQVLTYVRKDTHNKVKAALIFDERERDLSDLVEELLSDWLKKQK